MSPGGDTATSKLVNSRQSRKKAEEDVKLLANRIQLLKMEEKKVLSLLYSYYHLFIMIVIVGVEEDRGDKEEGQRNNEGAPEEHGDVEVQAAEAG